MSDKTQAAIRKREEQTRKALGISTTKASKKSESKSK